MKPRRSSREFLIRDGKCRCLSIIHTLATVLLALSSLASVSAQGNTGHTGDLSILEDYVAQGRHLLATQAATQDQKRKAQVKRFRRKPIPIPKHKRRANTNSFTESYAKDGKIDQWTRTHSVSRLGPRRTRPLKSNNRRSNHQPKSKKHGKARRTSRPAVLKQKRPNFQQRKQASRKPKASHQKRVGRRPTLTRTSHPKRKVPQNKKVQKRPSPQAKRILNRRRPQKKQPQKPSQPAASNLRKGSKAQGFHWRGKGRNGFKWNNKRRRPHRIPWKGKVVYDEGDVICVAQSERDRISTESRSAEIHSQAVAQAFEYLCDPGPDFDLVVLEEWFEEAEAHAFAEAAVKARLTCKSKTRHTPNTCVSYSASATAIAEATAEAHAEAVAVALKSCPCMNSDAAAAFGSASMFFELVADAAVTAEATVCVEGREIETQVVWERCTSQLYAKLFSRAIAEAATHGDCLSAEARGMVKAYVGADITVHNTKQCDAEPAVHVRGESEASKSDD